MHKKTAFPFAAIVGQERMKKALLLNAINPRLGGVLIRGEKGTAKSIAVRALAGLLPETEVVKDCPFGCDPRESQDGMCPNCRERIKNGEKLSSVRRKVKVVDLPLGATEERVVGSLNMEQAIKKGEKIFEPGLLANVHRGILYVDEVNLLDDHLVDVLLDAAAMGVNYVERENISFSHPAKFILIGTMNPEEGELRPQLLDRFGLCAEIEGLKEPESRREIVKRWHEYEMDPTAFKEKWQKEEDNLSRSVLKARKLLPEVVYSEETVALVVRIATEMGVHGHRADIFMLKTAQTLASLCGRNRVDTQDVKEAAELVLPHRMRRKPFEEIGMEKEKLEEIIRDSRPARRTESKKTEKNGNEEKKENNSEKGEKSSKTQQRDDERQFEVPSPYPVTTIKASPQMKANSGKRSKTQGNNGKYVASKLPVEKAKDIALDATIRAASLHQGHRQRRSTQSIVIEPQDIREKVREKKANSVVVFVIDSSGSMGIEKRMVDVKGAILSLLVGAYQSRDKVGIVAFKGNKAETLLQPTSSIELAKKQLEKLPTGGKTPLSAGLSLGFQMLQNELKKNQGNHPLLLLLSDGRANVSMGKDVSPLEETTTVGREIKDAGIDLTVIDTEIGFIRLRKMEKLAKSLSTKYYQLEEIEVESLIPTC